ncbi:MAG: Kynurenine formamidase [Methanoregula sp. PtaU1.Bin051]|nr:MAG: Kynurenine formamidase [Methanoregula sp. PtaU1.Bin051]
MKIHDVSRPLFRGDIVYPGDLAPSFRQEERGLYLISDLHFSSHAGTHIDAPVHYLKTGMTIDEIPLDMLIGKCRVIDVRKAGSTITASHLSGRISGTERILLKTEFAGKTGFYSEYSHLSLDAAQLLTGSGMKCIGIDSPSIEACQCDGSVHRELLSHNCIIIELLDLEEIREGDYMMAALPLRLAGVDGAPARVVLIETDG